MGVANLSVLLVGFGIYKYLIRIFLSSSQQGILSASELSEFHRFRALTIRFMFCSFRSLTIVMITFSLGYMNYVGLFFNFIISPILFVPSRAWRSFRFIWVLICFAAIAITLNELGLDRVWLTLEKSVRMFAFYGTSHLYRYAVEAGLTWLMVAFYLVGF